MKRRNFFHLIPLTFTGLEGLAQYAIAEPDNMLCTKKNNNPTAMTYIQEIMDMLKQVRQTQSENILEAAYAVARTIENGNTCWSYWDHGHTHSADGFADREGDPGIITIGYDIGKSRKKDTVLISYPFGQDMYDDIKEKDPFVIGAPTPVGGDCMRAEDNLPSSRERRFRPLSDIWIDTPITSIGAVVQIPGSPAPLGPVSGPLYLTLWWMINADACRILSLKGKTFKVKGYSPLLEGDNIPWVNTADPLMDNYFDTVMTHMRLFGSELGEMRKMAAMAADTLISGGHVYFYSKHRESMASEALYRRGGFGFARGLSDGSIEGRDDDMVIMGVTRPDDPVDLANLKTMKKRGMRTASIGPVTNGTELPDGNTIAQQTDVHIGKFYDAYGLYAIPGFDRKVCPTSGLLNVTALWAMSVEIAMEVIRRTGNTPGIHYSGALTWGRSYNNQMRKVVEERGY